ncbi:tRNA lysidine(34) synthetase TilS [Massilia sp. Mn16-1_5]|uniref:tRNA lysidine(34) synthetase TilS n=1 Tax=Massilia sp. Mn16-1_5 TaxID=2079199 RepID=UPI00109E40A2|nr:tRNA lysidine(34) synthetase TilS [Massilia sp. Mn16-1_5]THC42521.1 tRNA lysidine(34) synthetase TilS [Massilia sp. Mn16-1_5]
MSSPQAGSVPAIFARALAALRDQFSPSSVAIACSGGLDSMALLQLATSWCQAQSLPLFVFHVHHGLSPHADAWQNHVAASASARGLRFDVHQVAVDGAGTGTEAAARKLRYRALGAMCREHGATLLLTAHHLDDQAETVLLQLLRGSGPAGLSGMDAANSAPELLGNPDLVMARPLLPLSRAELEAYARDEGLDWVEDESNLDPRYARNALRHQVMPALAQAFPGFQARFARSAAHAQSAQRLLTELAAQDLDAALVDGAIDVPRLRSMSLDRVYNLLRYWFAGQNLAMPSTAWLAELVAQLIEARHDAQLLVTHPACHLRRHRDRLYVTPKLPDLPGMRDPDDEGVLDREGQSFRWQGEGNIAFPDYGGVLHFETGAPGIGFDPAWLRQQELVIDFRKGGERLKLAANRPTRPLKAHYQAVDIPAWERTRLPIVSSGRDLLFAAGLGMDCHHFAAAADTVSLRWESTAK